MAFSKVAETGNLSKAARELNITPSAVSKSLTLLEQRMDVLLVKRTTRGARLTEHGKAFFERVCTILADVEEAIDEANSFRGCPSGVLRLTCSVAFGCVQLMPLIARYMELYPEVEVKVSLDDRYVNLGGEEFDIALRITGSTDWVYAARDLAPIRWVYCASPAYLSQCGRPASPEELAANPVFRCLVYPAMTSHGAWAFWHDGGVRQVKIHGKLECNSSLSLLTATLNHSGIACLPTYVASTYILNRELEVLFVSHRAASAHRLYAMYFPSRYKNPVIRTFIDFLISRISPLPPWDAALIGKIDFGPDAEAVPT